MKDCLSICKVKFSGVELEEFCGGVDERETEGDEGVSAARDY